MSKAISLFFWSSKVFENKARENYGDLLSPYIVAQTSGKTVKFYNAPKKQKKWFQPHFIMAIGSIMSYASKKAHIWGSGIISRKDLVKGGRFYAVRGPLSRKRILELGHSCPEVYGDPALLLPKYYNNITEKKYDIGIIPHYVDFKQINYDIGDNDTVHIIDLMTDNHFKTTDEIVQSERVVSSSLHGVIVAHAYGIPAIWVRFSDKLSGDNVKFEDYFLSVGIEPYTGKMLDKKLTLKSLNELFDNYPSLPLKDTITALQKGLLKSFPQI